MHFRNQGAEVKEILLTLVMLALFAYTAAVIIYGIKVDKARYGTVCELRNWQWICWCEEEK